MSRTLLALALTGLALAGCAEEEPVTPAPVPLDAEVVTEPADDLVIEDPADDSLAVPAEAPDAEDAAPETAPAGGDAL